jgi:hypothetical protein
VASLYTDCIIPAPLNIPTSKAKEKEGRKTERKKERKTLAFGEEFYLLRYNAM